MEHIRNLNNLKLSQTQHPFTAIMQSNIQSKQTNIFQGANQVLIHTKESGNIIYIPAYLRIKINRVLGINYLEARAEIESELRIWILLAQFPIQIQEDIIKKGKLLLNNETVFLRDIRVTEENMGTRINNKAQNVLEFKVQRTMTINIENDPFWSPFELINLVAYLHLQKIQLQSNFQSLQSPNKLLYQNATVAFNFIDAHSFLQFSFGELRHLGVFDLAQNLVDMQFSATSFAENNSGFIDQQTEEDDSSVPLILGAKIIALDSKVKKEKLLRSECLPQAYSFGRILVPLYKFPGTTIINVFLPFYILSFLSLGVFFQKYDLTNRSASIATYQIAFIAFFPTIRASLPETPKIVFAEILIYIQALCAIICFGESIYHNRQEGYEFIWDKNIPFLVSLTLTFLNLSIVLVMLLVHKCFWQPKYNSMPPGSEEFIGKKWINTDDWYGQQCQKQFKQAIEINVIKPLFYVGQRKMSEKRKQTLITSQRNKSVKFNEIKRTKLL